jgi:hypothetical protein
MSESEFMQVLAANPNAYARRMSSHALDAISVCYFELGKRNVGGEDLKRSADYSQKALTALKEMEALGELGDLDRPMLEQLEKRIAGARTNA